MPNHDYGPVSTWNEQRKEVFDLESDHSPEAVDWKPAPNESYWQMRKRLEIWATESHPWMGRMLSVLFDRYPNPVAEYALAKELGADLSEEGNEVFNQCLSRLESLHLLIANKDAATIRAVDRLFTNRTPTKHGWS